MKICIPIFASMVLGTATMMAQGATLARWNTTVGDNSLGNYEATETADGVTASALHIGDGLKAGGSTAANIFAAAGYDQTSAKTAMSAGDYWETSLTVASGNELQLTGITIGFGGPKNGPQTCQLAWSADNKTTWTYLKEFDLGRQATKYFKLNLTADDLDDLAYGVTGTVWFRLVAWNGGTQGTACGSLGQKTDGLVFQGEVLSSEGEPTVEFRPASTLAYVGETLTLTVCARPMGAKVTSITVNPMPEGTVTPNLSAGTWTFLPMDADLNKSFTVAVTVSNAYGQSTGCMEVPVKGFTAAENGMTWRVCLVGETAMVTGAYPTEGELIIPSSLGGYPVTAIGESAFSNCSGLTGVTIPDSVTSIASNVFASCSGLMSVVMGNGVTNIGIKAFTQCSNMTSVVIPQFVCKQQLSSVFPSSYQHLTNVVIGSTVTSIASNAFADCISLTSVRIPEGVTTIGVSAFSGCSGLADVTIPNSVTSIGDGAFSGCANELFDRTILDGVNFVDGWVVGTTRDISSTLDLTGIRGIADGAFSGCSTLISVTLPEYMTRIGNNAFYSCVNLTSITIPESVSTIGSSTFAGCSALESLTILGDITNDWKQDSSPFQGCTNLVTLELGGNMTKIGAYMFAGINTITTLTLPDGITSIGSHAFDEWTGLESLIIPDSVTNIAGRAFGFCTSLSSLALGNGLSIIGPSAFRACTSLEEVTIPNGVTTISDHAFYQCTGLKTASVGAGVHVINAGTFRDCSALISIELQYGVTDMKVETFYNCRSLPTLWIPASVTNIGRQAFFGCDSLETLWVPASWKGTDMLYDAEVPYGCKICYYNPDAGENETMTTPIPVPHGWLEENAAALLEANTNDYETTASGPAANGHSVWECYLAGLSTTNAAAEFKVKSIEFVNGQAVVKWDPDLNEGETKKDRSYVVEGAETLGGEWGETNAASRFFRVKVEMPLVGD